MNRDPVTQEFRRRVVARAAHNRDRAVMRDWGFDRAANMTPAESAEADLARWEEATAHLVKGR